MNIELPSIEPANQSVKCLQCGKEFLAQTKLLFDRVIYPSICPSCADDRDFRLEEWAAKCPREFRTPEEAGGNTSIARMDREHPNWRRVLNWQYGPKGLLVRGETGRCKTRAMWRLIRRLFDERLHTIALTSAQFDRQCRDAGGTFTLTQWFDRLASVDVLFLDDLGKASWTQATEAQLFDLIDERSRNGRPILATTNDSGTTLAARLSPDRAEPLVRRLRDYCELITL